MIRRFSTDTALLVIDVQKGVDRLDYYGGANGRRNNPDAEANMLALIDEWRSAGCPLAFTCHDSREPDSPLKLSLESGEQKPGFEPAADDIVIVKDVNSGFIGTSLEVDLRRAGVDRLVIVGFFTNMCVETTTRMAGNLGFDTYLVTDCCAASNRIGPDGVDHDPELVHQMTVANLHGEFCTTLRADQAASLLATDGAELDRAQGNEVPA